MKIFKNFILYLIIIFLFAYNLHQCNERVKENKNSESSINYLQSELESYEDEFGEIVSSRNSLAGKKEQLEILTSNQIDSLNKLNSLLKKYKRVESAGIIKTETKIKNVLIPFDKPAPCEFERNFELIKPFYEIRGYTNELGTKLNSLVVPNSVYFASGLQKNGLFKKNTYTISVKNSNPLVETIGLDNYILTPKIQRWGIGPYIGYDPFQQEFSGGLSVQYSIIRF